jgi:tRNA pseudouridine38-40 synthase
MRYFLQLSYKGTAYAGFQIQQNAHTVQQELEQALQTLYRQPISLTGSSRTDAGVHAIENYFHFDTETELSPKTVYNLNALLPADISVKGLYQVPDTAHCRFDAVAREYEYYIYRQKDPFLADRGWRFPYPLNLEAMQEAAQVLMGYEDFTSFSKRNTQVNTFECRIAVSEWRHEEGMLVYKVRANRFLRGMVRGLVGTLVKLGRGRIDLGEFREIVEAKDCSRADFSTPPQGLFLKRVIFRPELAAKLGQGGGEMGPEEV